MMLLNFSKHWLARTFKHIVTPVTVLLVLHCRHVEFFFGGRGGWGRGPTICSARTADSLEVPSLPRMKYVALLSESCGPAEVSWITEPWEPSAALTSLPAGQGTNLTGLTWMESDKCNPTIRPLTFLITVAAVCSTESIATSQKELQSQVCTRNVRAPPLI